MRLPVSGAALLALLLTCAPAMAAPSWEEFLARSRAIEKSSLVQPPEALTRRETLPQAQAAPLRRAVVLAPQRLEAGVELAINDLIAYLQAVTGQPVPRLADLAGAPPEATVIAIKPPAAGQGESYVLRAERWGRRPVVVVDGDGWRGTQYGLYRLMTLSGKRFYSYVHSYTPPVGQAVMPANGYRERFVPSLAVRGFAPHLYHPIPLSLAFHEPGEAHLALVKRYIDWAVANHQNYLLFPLLELDAASKFLPVVTGEARFQAWLPHARAIVTYAHARGVRMAIKPAFANYVSANVFAINPLTAMAQSARLNGERERAEAAEARLGARLAAIASLDGRLRKEPSLTRERLRLVLGAEAARAERDAHRQRYEGLLTRFVQEDRMSIGRLIDRLMQVPWDEICWNLGTSEFSPTNDDLTIAWMNTAAAETGARHPGVRTTVRSHVPLHPYSRHYQESYFNLVRFARPEVGVLVHTTHAYALTDPASVYGNENFEHKLRLLWAATPERVEIYYPETSYWVQHDVSVPLFLPVYMLNRKHDLAMLAPLQHLDGHVGFTTGWEWGYWLNDYVLARLQSDPTLPLSAVLDGAFAPFGPNRAPMVALLNEAMLAQQAYLIDQGLIRHLQGADWLSDLGAWAKEAPLTRQVVEGSNNVPVRLAPRTVMGWSLAQLAEFEAGELAAIDRMSEDFARFAEQARVLEGGTPEAARAIHDELADGFTITALRARQVRSVFHALVAARRSALTGSEAQRAVARAHLAVARMTLGLAEALIRHREAAYREPLEDTIGTGPTPTMWGNRYLTRVHTLEFWHRTQEEAQGLIR